MGSRHKLSNEIGTSIFRQEECRRITMKERGSKLFFGESAQRWPLVGIMAEELQKKSRRKFGFPKNPGAGERLGIGSLVMRNKSGSE